MSRSHRHDGGPDVGIAYDGHPYVYVTSTGMLRAWLAEQDGSSGCWVVTRKPADDDISDYVSYDDLVMCLIAYGWVDSKARSFDERKTMCWVSPRRPRSGWAASNVERIERLRKAGLMTAQGEAVIAAAVADGSWEVSAAAERLDVPQDLRDAFSAFPGSEENWEKLPRGVKRRILEWIGQAKRAETRATRISRTAKDASEGIRTIP